MSEPRAQRAVVMIRNKRGLHARASAMFVRVAERFNAKITVQLDDTAVSGTSIMGLMMLGAAPGKEISIETEGPQAEAALFALLALVDGKFGEDVAGDLKT